MDLERHDSVRFQQLAGGRTQRAAGGGMRGNLPVERYVERQRVFKQAGIYLQTTKMLVNLRFYL